MTVEEHIKKLMQQSTEFAFYVNNVLPKVVAVEAENFYKESFQNEGFTDEVLEPWQNVKRRTEPKRPDRAAATRPILTGDTGDLGRSIEADPQPGQVTITADTLGAGSDADYASAHNDGTTNAGRNRNVTIPQRKFIGESKTLNKIVIEKMEGAAKKILK